MESETEKQLFSAVDLLHKYCNTKYKNVAKISYQPTSWEILAQGSFILYFYILLI